MNLKVNVETFTPEKAKEILEEQEKRIANGIFRQRKLSEDTVTQYARDMQAGNWIATNQGIYFDEQGNLRDGRHRLWAVVKSGITVEMLVMVGPAEFRHNGASFNVVDVIDKGRPRSNPQQLTIDGCTYATQKCAALRSVAMLISGDSTIKLGIIPMKQMLARLDRHIGILQDICDHSVRFSRGALMGPIAFYHLAAPEMAEKFFEGYYRKVNLANGSPILALDAYFRARGAQAGSDVVMKGSQATALALYHWHRGAKINAIRNSSIGAEWLVEFCSKDTKKFRQMLSLPDSD